MANTRDLLIRLLGDSTGMRKALSEADAAAGKHDLTLKNLAGTIGSAYAAKQVIDFGKASVEAAAADEASQVTLATALRNTAGATDEQIAAAEKWIERTMFATGVTDDELRPALERLTRATGDVGEAQDLLGVAMDAAQGTGKSLQAVTEALGKAQDGNVGALARLGIATKDAEGRTLSFDQIVRNLSTTFEGQAAKAADTQAGKLAIMQARYGELQEQIGAALMPVMEQLVGVLSGLTEWFSSLDEGTQKWIIRIGILGGGLVLATRAVNGIVGPLKQLGIIGNTAQKSIDGIESSTGKMSKAAIGATTALAGIGAAVAVYEVLEARAAAAARSMDAFFESADAVAVEEFRVALLKMQAQVALTGGSVESTDELMKRFVASNIEGARRILDNADAAGLNAKQINSLYRAIRDAEEATRTKAETDKRYGDTLTDVTMSTEDLTAATQAGTMVFGAARTALDAQTTALRAARTAAHEAKDKQFELNTQIYNVQAAVNAQNTAWATLFGKYDEDTAFLNIATNFDGLKTKIAETETAMRNGTTSQEQGMRDVATQIIATKAEVSRYIEQLGTVPASKATEINAMIDRGEYDAVEKELAWLTRKRNMAVGVTFTDNATGKVVAGVAPKQAFDSGGVVAGPRGSPQLVLAHGGETFLPTHKSGFAPIGGGGGLTVNVALTVNGSVMTERDLTRSVYDSIIDGQRRGELLVGVSG